MCLNVTNGNYDGHGMSLVAKCLQSSYCHGGVVSFIGNVRQPHIVLYVCKVSRTNEKDIHVHVHVL